MTVNKDFILRVADAIEAAPDHHFDMTDFTDTDQFNCGTVMCIGGWAAALFVGKTDKDGEYDIDDAIDKAAVKLEPIENMYGTELVATYALGLTSEQAKALFYRFYDNDGYGPRTTKDEAVRVLRNLAETGEVDWETE